MKGNKLMLISISFLIFITLHTSCVAAPPPEINKMEVQKPPEPVFTITSISFSPETVFVGETMKIIATVSSGNNQPGQYLTILKIDNEQIAQETINVSAGLSSEVTFLTTIKNINEHEISIGDKSVKFKAIDFDTKHPVTIQYDHKGEGIPNYMSQGSFVWGGYGHLVWFTAPDYPFMLTAISMSAAAVAKEYGPLQDKFFTINIWDKKTGDKIWSKDYSWQIYDAGIHGGTFWQAIKIPGLKLNNDFYIEVVTNSDPPLQRPGVSRGTVVGDTSMMVLDYETTTEATRSSISYNGKPHPNSDFKDNWYIRAEGCCPLR